MRSSSISIRTPVRMGRVSSLLAAMITWETAWAKESPWTVPLIAGNAGSGGYSASGMVARWKLLRRQVRVTLLPSVSMSTGRGGQAAADVGKQASGDQDRALGGDVSSDLEACRGLVVEAREADGTGFSLEEQAGKYGYWRPRRQRPGGPGHGFCQDVPFDSELHGRVPPFIAAVIAGSRTTGPAWNYKSVQDGHTADSLAARSVILPSPAYIRVVRPAPSRCRFPAGAGTVLGCVRSAEGSCYLREFHFLGISSVNNCCGYCG